VIFVVAHAEPAELVAALATRHVHAALVLLDLHLALRAWLGVELEPDIVIVLALIDPVQPSDQVVALDGPMGPLKALEAPVVAAKATDNVGLLERRRGVGDCAGGTWTPFGLLIDIDEALLVVVEVARVLVRGENFAE
jgi:hypothetical protein